MPKALNTVFKVSQITASKLVDGHLDLVGGDTHMKAHSSSLLPTLGGIHEITPLLLLNDANAARFFVRHFHSDIYHGLARQ